MSTDYMNSISVVFYDGVVSKPHQAQLSAVDMNSILISYREQNDLRKKTFKLQQMNFIGALGKKCPVIELNNDARIEFQTIDIPEWVPIPQKEFQQKIWKLERTPALILFSVVFVVALGFSTLKWGIPFASKVVAFQLPANTLQDIGQKAEDYIVNDWTGPSKLVQGQQAQIKQEYLSKIAEGRPAKIIFRDGGRIGANALALPNNTIIVTDQLVEMAHSDQEILGVLAHEQGHLVERHSLQQALSSLGFSILLVAVTGDSGDLMTSLPVAILGAKYSRQFEQQADLYALKLMDKKHIEVSHFANFLQRMEDEELAAEQKSDQKAGKTANKDQQAASTAQATSQDHSNIVTVLEALSSHPATAERVQMVRDFEKQQKLEKP
ncbi:M48 family metallopeptidase [Acinetobacter sp. 1207_04]|uniref:M48 family metallopeptidase n=1 Tax=Acinetobacter sp. 1207_04 TaxID=2604449 RepID=UPI004059C75F